MDIKRLLDTIKMETDDLFWNLVEQLEGMEINIEYEHDDWIYANNNSSIMLVAHIDTIVRSPKLKFRVKHNRIKARNSILGADDRAGVYAIMEILSVCKRDNLPMPSVLFTNYEECGLHGVRSFIKSKKMEINNVNIFIELDRKGKNEYVYYFNNMPKPVTEWIESFGFIEKFGSLSDVMLLTNEYSIPHVNLSVGYYNQHTTSEVLFPSELQYTINKVLLMISRPLDKLYIVEPEPHYDYGMYCEYEGNNYYNRTGHNKYRKTTSFQEQNNFVPLYFNYNPITDDIKEVNYEYMYNDLDNLKGIHEMNDYEYDKYSEYY